MGSEHYSLRGASPRHSTWPDFDCLPARFPYFVAGEPASNMVVFGPGSYESAHSSAKYLPID